MQLRKPQLQKYFHRQWHISPLTETSQLNPISYTHFPAILGNTDTGTLNYNSWYIFQFVKKYGNIFSLNLGDVNSIMVTGLPLIKEVFTHMEENILKRPITRTRERISNNNGKFIEQHSVCIIVLLIC